MEYDRLKTVEEQGLLEDGVEYITGIHALNMQCSLDTCGDWHASALKWENIWVKNSSDSRWGEYGIEIMEGIPEHPGRFYVANHIRACLDLIEAEKFTVAQCMRNDFICNEKYTMEIFEKVSMLKETPQWEKVREFMKKEYRVAWMRYLAANGS